MGIGDEIMACGQARLAHARSPEKRVAILDRSGRRRWQDVWQGVPYILPLNHTAVKPLEIVNGPGVRPYIAAKTARQWTWREWPGGEGPPRGELMFDEAEATFGRQYAGRVILEPHTKHKASPNKDWGWVRWSKLAWLLQEKHHLRVTQLGPEGTPMLDGAELIATRSFRLAAAVLAGARAAVLPEGGLHHAAAALNVPAVVIYGGFISPRITGYAGQVSFFTGGEPCGMRVPCNHCREAMAAIRPEDVAERLIEVLRETSARLVSA